MRKVRNESPAGTTCGCKKAVRKESRDKHRAWHLRAFQKHRNTHLAPLPIRRALGERAEHLHDVHRALNAFQVVAARANERRVGSPLGQFRMGLGKLIPRALMKQHLHTQSSHVSRQSHMPRPP